MIRNPLLDKDFLRALDQEQEREVFARVISLNFEEKPIEKITGKVTQGSINIDGNSSVRRTCSLSLVAEEMNIHDYYWGLNTKFQLFIGLKNNIDSRYDDIIWFPQGIYLITTFNTSQTINNYTISLQGKDKMSLLNGEMGGVITALTQDFGTVDIQQADGSYVNQALTLKEIIQSAVHTFAREPFSNIIINDLEDYGIELMEYRGTEPIYLLVDCETQEVTNPRLGGQTNQKEYFYVKDDGKVSDELISVEDTRIIYDDRGDYLAEHTNPTVLVAYDGMETERRYTVIKIEYGETIGYRMTDLTYAGDLILSVGNTVTNLLDKIKNMLGDFEYFYDLDGRFIFQKKKTYLNTSWNNIVFNEDSETYVDNLTESSAITYNFENANIVTSFQNNPNLSNLKNDFSIWGVRKTQAGSEIPIHLRYAVDDKPKYYKNYDGKVWANMEFKKEVVKNNMMEEVLKNIEEYEKIPNPNGLSEDWWEIIDWAEYYKRLTGEYPTGSIGNYCQDYVPKGDIDLNSMFPPGTVWGEGRNIYIFDVEYNYTANGTMYLTLGYIGHGNGCSHSYSYFTNRAEQGKGTSYIYKPTIPKVEFDEKVNDRIDKEVEYLEGRFSEEWREILYQMAVDYYNHHEEDDFLIRVAENNINPMTGESFYPTGITGYEQYYTDIISFWRDIYNPEYQHTFKRVEITNQDYNKKKPSGEPIRTYFTPVQCQAGMQYEKGIQFLKKNEYRDYSFVNFTEPGWNSVIDKTYYYYLEKASGYKPENVYYIEITSEYDADSHWSLTALESPELLNFWIDFLDTSDGQMSICSAHNVGDRPKAENDSNVKAIYFRDTPNVIFVNPLTLKKEERLKILKAYETEAKWEEAIKKDYEVSDQKDVEKIKTDIISTMVNMRIAEIKALRPGYTIVRLNSAIENLFNISARGKSAYDVLDNNLYQYSHCAETISITALPVYYLEPNTRISIKDDNSGINGEYIINKITLPLQYQGTMNISATKAVERLY